MLQQREIAETLAALRSAGAEARYLALDVRDRALLAAHLAEVRREWGPIRGVIHGAGVLADHLIKDKPVEEFDEVFSVKIDGLRSSWRRRKMARCACSACSRRWPGDSGTWGNPTTAWPTRC